MISCKRTSLVFVPAVAFAVAAAVRANASVIPPVVLQGCSPEVKVYRAFSRPSAPGFDVSFINTSTKAVVLVLIRIGDTLFAWTGSSAPGSVTSWKVAAVGRSCSIRAVRFADGTEWKAPPEPSTSPQ